MIIKDAEIIDSIDLFEWRNDQLSCCMSKNNKKLTIKEHEIWFKGSLKNPLRKLYVGIDSNGKIGVCRFDYDELDNCSEISINLNPKMRGKNLSYEFLNNSIKKYVANNSCKLKATIKKENKASLKIFEKSGFLYFAEDSNFFYLRKIQD
jgi:UDP-2,4-diacetamido-2,4,6-trideoxy-beta-L-altropyranose hydrolase